MTRVVLLLFIVALVALTNSCVDSIQTQNNNRKNKLSKTTLSRKPGDIIKTSQRQQQQQQQTDKTYRFTQKKSENPDKN